MNNRQRFHAACNFQPLDRPCQIEQGFWEQTYQRWQAEGLPEQVAYPELFGRTPENDLFGYFDVGKFAYARMEQYFIPEFPEETLDETARYRIFRTARGVTLREMKDSVSMPEFIDYPIKDRHDYLALRERLLGSPDRRFPADWEAIVADYRNQERDIVCTHMDGFFGYPRELMGVERLLFTYYDDPDLIHMIIQDRLQANIQLYSGVIEAVRPDFAFIWEDMSYKNGPLISPKMFRRFMLPAYQELTAFLRRMGVKIILVDSDGNTEQLIPLWLEGGVSGFLPFEVRAGMDVISVRQRYPHIQIMGGIEKHCLERDPASIDAELTRVLPPMQSSGGYIVSLDHWVHSEIPLQNFRYYVDRVRRFGG
ncbi:MAG: uroporphyrinogen decarboxylase family protein [Omnitrophica WOR_2 bacterium]